MLPVVIAEEKLKILKQRMNFQGRPLSPAERKDQ